MIKHRTVLMAFLAIVVVVAFQLRYMYDTSDLNRPNILSRYLVNRSDPWDVCKNIRNPNDKRYGAQPDTYDEVFDLTLAEANVAARERGSEPLIILVYSKDIDKNNPPDFPWGLLATQGRTNKCSLNCVTLDNRMCRSCGCSSCWS